MVYSTGVQVLTTLAGTERVEVDNGGPVRTVAPTGLIAKAPIPFGSSTGAGSTFAAAGNLATQVSIAGVQPASLAADVVLAAFTIPANAFDQANRALQIQAEGSFGATANNKRVKIVFNATTAVVGQAVTGGTTVADTGVVATNGGGWALSAEIVKAGAANSNTQLAVHQQAQVGAAVSTLLAPQAVAAVENAPILVAITGNATTALSDILFNFLQAFAQN